MPFLTSLFTAAAALLSTVSAFAATDCNKGVVTNFHESGNCKCQAWSANFLSYQSDEGLTLTVYSGENCSGDMWVTDTQQVCQTVPFAPAGIKAC